MRVLHKYSISFILLFVPLIQAQSTWQSEKVYFGSGGRLVYSRDSEKNMIPDFSFAGYKNGEQSLPVVNVVKTISPVAGDNTANIQSAIDEVGKMPLQNGIRGALLLKAGKYNVSGTLKINYSGVVLRGEGDGDDPSLNTIIFGTGNTPNQRTIIEAGGGSNNKWNSQISGSVRNIISDKVYVGEKTFRIDNVSGYSAGDNIIIVHPNSPDWLKAVNYGSTASDAGWSTSDGLTIIYNRFINKINGDTLTIDAPVFNTLDRSLSQSYIYKYTRSGLMTNIGIENLRVDIEIPVADLPTNQNGNEAHAWEAIELVQIEDSWVKNSTMIHFGHSGIMTSTATRITIDNCKAIDPISIITGERRYNFNMYAASQLILIKNSYTRYGRHDYVSNGTTSVSGCVFTNNVSEKTYASSEGHRWWSQGLLYDNITFNTPNTGYVLGLYNRGDYGTGHGWASAHSVAWNCKVNGGKNIIIQKPPTAQNYAIGCIANSVTGQTPSAPFSQPEGFIEGSNRSGLYPASLYQSQLDERLITDVREPEMENKIPTEIYLEQNYPNPFNPNTNISYSIKNSATIRIKLYDSLGRELMVLFSGYQPAGRYTINVSLNDLSSGVYIYELSSSGIAVSKKMQLIK